MQRVISISVETIRFNDASAASDPYVAERIQKAEAIWFAGGDQWNYVRDWRNSAGLDGGVLQQETADAQGNCRMIAPATAQGLLLLKGEERNGPHTWKLVR